MTGTPSFGVQASPTSKYLWLETARRCEDLGYDLLCVGDHTGSWPSPFVALGAAAAVTDGISLGPYVANAGLRTPLGLATDIATLDIISNGRAILGLGAGHTPHEWEMQARKRPCSDDRVDRLIAVSGAVTALLSGEEVTRSGRWSFVGQSWTTGSCLGGFRSLSAERIADCSAMPLREPRWSG